MLGRAERKRKLREWADGEHRRIAQTTPRDPRSEMWYPGLGQRYIGLLVMPSFEAYEAWDVRASSPGDTDFAVYASRSKDPANPEAPPNPESPPDRQLLGYQRLDTTAIPLAAMVARLVTMQIPVWVHASGIIGLDGVTSEVVITTEFMAALRVSWWGDGPEVWRALTSVVRDMVAAFRGLPPLDDA